MENWLHLDDKVMIVTGGSSGIGKSIVNSLLEKNARVINFDLKTTDSFDNENYFFYKVDVSKKNEVEDQVA
jgi:sorbitol-6-phosphate 2-dehydrogenase